MALNHVVAALVSVAFFQNLRAQDTLTAGQPVDVRMSPVILEAGVQLYRDAVERDEVRGCVLLVARRGKIVVHQAIGWADKERRIAMTKRHLFRMASNTKPVVAACLLDLLESGKARLDDYVRNHLPSFDNHRSGHITIRQLLSHTSGFDIPGIFPKPLVKKTPKSRRPSLQAQVDRFGGVGSQFPPGSRYHYNNANYNVLGALCEVFGGASLEKVLAERIYKPLGLRNSCNFERRSLGSRMCKVYLRDDDRWKVTWKPDDGPTYPFARGSGGMISTARDYAVFCQMFRNGGIYGGVRVLSRKTIAEATRNQIGDVPGGKDRDRNSYAYGLGWRVYPSGRYEHSGAEGTFAWVDPGIGVVGVVLTQSRRSRNPYRQFRRVVDAACLR